MEKKKSIFVLLRYIFPDNIPDDQEVEPTVEGQSTNRGKLRALMGKRLAARNIDSSETFETDEETIKGGYNSRGLNVMRLIRKEKWKEK